MKVMSLRKGKIGTDVVLISLQRLINGTCFASVLWVQIIFVVCPALNFNLNKDAHPPQWHGADWIYFL